MVQVHTCILAQDAITIWKELHVHILNSTYSVNKASLAVKASIYCSVVVGES